MLTQKETIRHYIESGASYDDLRELIDEMETQDQREKERADAAKRERVAAAKEGLISAYACYLTEAGIMTEAEVAQIDWKRFYGMLDDMAASVKNMKDLSKSFKVVKIGHDDEALDLKGVLDKLGLL